MGKSSGVASSIWSQDVARAVALQRHMPGVQQLQTQYVRYSGQAEAQQCDDGWSLSASRAQVARISSHSHRVSDSGTEACMSVTGPTSPRGTTATPPLTCGAPHASQASLSPTPCFGGVTDLFGGEVDVFGDDADAISLNAPPVAACGGIGGDSRTSMELPQQVQLTIVNAPAEFCMPIKRDKRFRPNFQVEVRVMHEGSLHLPLRVGVFAITQEDRNRIVEWLPPECVPAMEAQDSGELPGSEKRKRTSKNADKLPLEERLRRRGLKTHTILSHVFQSPDGGQAAAHPSHSEAVQNSSDAGASKARRGPFFPSSSAPLSGPPDPNIVDLAECKSLVARSDDPEMATRVKLGGVQNTLLAQFEYQRLEFEIPSEVTPVFLVFACLVGNNDLLYTLYTPPSVSMCRRDQQAKSLAVLGLPKNAMQQVDVLRGTSRAAVLPNEGRIHKSVPSGLSSSAASGAAAQPAPQLSFGEMRKPDSETSQQMALDPQRTPRSAPISLAHPDNLRESFWAAFDRDTMMPNSVGKAASKSTHASGGYGASIQEDNLRLDNLKDWERPSSGTSQSMSVHSRRWSNPPLLDRSSHGSMSIPPSVRRQPGLTLKGSERFSEHLDSSEAGGRHSEPGAGIPPIAREPLWAAASLNQQVDDMLNPFHTQPSLDKGTLGLREALPIDVHADSTPHFPQPGTPAASTAPSDSHLFPFSQHAHHSSGQLSIPMPPPSMATSDQHPQLFRNASDAMSTDDHHEGGGFTGGLLGGFGGFSGIPAAPPMFSAPALTGYAQAAVFSWTHQEYCASGMLRDLTCVEARSLLSLAGFPDLAGIDKSARISSSQFTDFKAFFSATVASVEHVATLWNEHKPSCVVAGFDVDRAHASESLEPQPVGTFVCFFSMQSQFAGHLVVACKVPPGQAGTDSSTWQPQIAYLAVSPGDLQAGNLEGILMGMPYATHVLDYYTGLRHDKRSRVPSSPPPTQPW